jgi:hypothetical protein
MVFRTAMQRRPGSGRAEYLFESRVLGHDRQNAASFGRSRPSGSSARNCKSPMLRGNQQRSGTGTRGSTLRVCIERYQADLGTLGDELLRLRERTGRARPDVVT